MKFWSWLPVGVLRRRFFSYFSIELGKFKWSFTQCVLTSRRLDSNWGDPFQSYVNFVCISLSIWNMLESIWMDFQDLLWNLLDLHPEKVSQAFQKEDKQRKSIGQERRGEERREQVSPKIMPSQNIYSSSWILQESRVPWWEISICRYLK